MFKQFTTALSALVFLTGGTLFAQNSDPLIYTVGKVFPTGEPAGTTHHAYVLWQPGDPATTFGKQFAIYRKDGISTSANAYARLGQTKLQTGPRAIHALLKLGHQFDFNAGGVAARINSLYAESTSQPGTEPALPAIPGLPEAEKLAYLLNIAKDDPKVLERVFFLGRAHPGVYMALGHGFSIKVDGASVHTYEVREVDAGGNDVRVVGRVTLDAANPTELTRTSRPFGVVTPPKAEQQEVASAQNHLVTRQRWGIPDDLRRLFPHTFGFNLYRVREQVAINRGWDVLGNYPDPGDLEQLVKDSLPDPLNPDPNPDPDAKRINMLPIIATALMTEAEAADTVTDGETFFTHDDNDPPDNAFEDGETFFYYVAARDIAGHPGPISNGTRVVICDRLPPTVPMIESVRNIFTSPAIADLADLKSNQHFKIRIRQSDEAPEEDAATNYLIYRWDHHTQHITDGGNPATNLVATVTHMPGEDYIDWEDNGPGAPTITPTDETEFGKTHWYTVRAEDDTACATKNLSGHSPPAFGVLRDRVGPGKPSGVVKRFRYLPVTTCLETAGAAPPGTFGLPDDYVGFVAFFQRFSQNIHSVDLEIVDTNSTAQPLLFKTTRFFSAPPALAIPVPLSVPQGAEYIFRARCRTKTGLVSNWRTCNVSNATHTNGNINVRLFQLRTTERCLPSSRVPGDTPSPHDVDGPTGNIVGPLITLTIPEESAEYRIYRRVGDEGAFELISRASSSTSPNPIPPVLPDDIDYIDPAPPTAGGTEVCYFGQVFDENGNAGPRTKIGCVTIKSGDLATPMLAEVELLAVNAGKAQIKLSWFCDPVGIDRFEVWCAASSSGDPGLESNNIGPKLDTLDGANISPDTSNLAFCGYQTKALSGGFGNGSAEFNLTLVVPVSQALTFAVRGVGKGSYQNPPVDDDARPQGPFSNTVSGVWQPPPPPPPPVLPRPPRAVAGRAPVGRAGGK